LLVECRISGEVLIPDHEPSGDQHHDEDRHEPEDELLASVVLADLREVLLVSAEHVAELREPDVVGAVPEIGAEEPDEKSAEAEEQDHADPRMDRARALAAPEEPRQEEEARMEERQA